MEAVGLGNKGLLDSMRPGKVAGTLMQFALELNRHPGSVAGWHTEISMR
jgi:hypothetical protein